MTEETESAARIEIGDEVSLNGRKATVREFHEKIYGVEHGELVTQVTVNYYFNDSEYIVDGLVPQHAIQTAVLSDFLEMVDDDE